MKNKTTLEWHVSKKKPGSESMYDGIFSSKLLFEARSQSLEANARTCR